MTGKEIQMKKCNFPKEQQKGETDASEPRKLENGNLSGHL